MRNCCGSFPFFIPHSSFLIQNMARYVFLTIIILSLALAGGYAYLGGFRQPTVKLLTTGRPVFLAGQAFRGRANDERFGPLFRQAKEAQDQGRIKGDLANLFLDNPDSARDTMRAFIGLAVADTSQPLPRGFRYRLVPAGQRVVAARLTGVSYLLAPNKLYPGAFAFIEQHKLKQRNLYLERFGAGEESEVWVGVQ
jgi:hypothetical protein